MNDLISRQDAIDALGEEPEVWYSDDDIGNGMRTQWGCDREAIEALPSAEPEIIRCKDCKYASPNGKYGCKAYHFKQYEVHEMYADDFCSKGERRES